MRVRYLQTIWTLATLALTSAAFGHLELLEPKPRLPAQANGGQVKMKPCGQSANMRTGTVTTFKPGETIQVKIREYVDHPGYFAVAFDNDGDNDFPFPIANEDDVVASTDDPKARFPLSDKVLGFHLDAAAPKGNGNCADNDDATCTISVKLPNIQCQNCTLQVIQFMYDKLDDGGANEYYYQCADLKLEGALMPGGGGAGGGGAGGGGGNGSGGASGSSGSGGAGGSAIASAGSGGATAGSPTGGSPSGGSAAGSGTSGAASGGAPSTGGSATAAAGTSAATPAEDDGGCTVARLPRSGALPTLGAGLLLGLGWFARRRNRTQ